MTMTTSSRETESPLFPMLYPQPADLFAHWSRSVQTAFDSAAQFAELATHAIDVATLYHINTLTKDIVSGVPLSSSAVHPAETARVADREQRIAVVTGGCGGIGTEICRRLARDGNKVIATYIASEREFAQQWQAERRAENLEIDALECDVTDFSSCERMAAEIDQRYGGADILVNCAGITRDNTLRKMDESHWHAVLDTNLDSVFNVTKHFVEGMAERQFGRIINISSVNGQKGQFGQTNYSAAKAGMLGFTRSLARELADQGITVNTVSPGYVNTRMAMAVPEDVRNGIIAKIPVGRLAEPAEIAHAVAFLASENSGYITGSDLSINGGLYMM